MAFDYKKEYRELYLPGAAPSIITVPEMVFAAVRGRGDPNREDGEYRRAVAMLYTVAYTIRMSERTGLRIPGFHPFVVPPLESLWRQEGIGPPDLRRKEDFQWVALLRMPDYVTQDVFARAVRAAAEKKKIDLSAAALFSWEEGLCVQCLHTGPYDEEAGSIERMRRFLFERGWEEDLGGERLHHEIYLSDPRKVPPERRKTVIRLPIRRCRNGE